MDWLPMASRRAPRKPRLDPAPAKDALEQAILDALDRHLDPDLFEKCAVDLLSSVYPSLTPVRGGSDGGFDGEFWTDNAHANPLVTTTGLDLRRNLKKNLEEALSRGPFTEAVFATSRPASPQKRRTLTELAVGLGVTKLAIHDKDWFASRLYRDPVWCQKLLGVTGRPSALAPDVELQAHHLASELVGRDGVVAALASSPADVILVGGPGIGKTSVLRQLNTRANGYFAVDADRTALADAIRSKQPSIVVVDDAGISVELLRSVLLVRGQVGAQFRVVASCWTSHKDDVACAFGELAPKEVTLGLLPADTIVQILDAVGVREPLELVRRIVRQAEGRPGLATTLARAALNRDVQAVVNGNVLLQHLAPTLKRHLEIDATRLLGCFGLGGRRGMPTTVVADHLRRARDDVTEVLANLSAAGVIRVGREGSISVWPQELRFALVARTFFSDPRLPYEELADHAPSQADLLATVIGAKWAGGQIPELPNMVERSSDPKVWSFFASLGAQESRHALKCRPDLLDALAPIALSHIPDEVLPLLFDQASQSKDIPGLVDTIDEWARKIDDAALMVQRSQTLVDAAAHWLDRRRESSVAIAAACVAMNPYFSMAECDPGLGMTVRFSQGMLVREALAAIEALWPQFVRMLEMGPTLPWHAVLDLVGAWCSGNPMVSLDDTTEICRRDVAGRMIQDLAQLAGAQNAVKHRLRQLARMVNLQIDIHGDDTFEVLYPNQTETDWEDWQAANGRQAMAAKTLAAHWVNAPADEVARQLLEFSNQVAEVNSRMGSTVSVFANELALCYPNPRDVLETFVRAGLDIDVVWPFAKRCADQDRAATIGFLLASPDYVRVALEMAILGKPFDRVMIDQCVRANPQAASVLSMWIPHLDSQDLLQYLLEHEDQSVAVTTAVGLWQRKNHEAWLNHLRAAWEGAFLRSALMELRHTGEYCIEQILRKNTHLALGWLLRHMGANRPHNDLAVLAARLLTHEQRVQALSALPAIVCYRKVLVALVGGDAERFRHLLSLPHMHSMHLSPLEGHPSDTWAILVPIALKSGYSEREVAGATLAKSWSWSGKRSDMWRGWLDSASPYLHHEDRSICRVAGVIMADIEKRHAQALESEHREQIYGVGEDD